MCHLNRAKNSRGHRGLILVFGKNCRQEHLANWIHNLSFAKDWQNMARPAEHSKETVLQYLRIANTNNKGAVSRDFW